ADHAGVEHRARAGGAALDEEFTLRQRGAVALVGAAGRRVIWAGRVHDGSKLEYCGGCSVRRAGRICLFLFAEAGVLRGSTLPARRTRFGWAKARLPRSQIAPARRSWLDTPQGDCTWT